MIRRWTTIAVVALLLVWGGISFASKVTEVAPLTGVTWTDVAGSVVAEEVLPRTPAWRGGLRPGDRLRAIDGIPVTSSLAAQQAPWRVPAGGSISCSIERDGEAATVGIRPIWVGGGTPVYYYFAIVGLTCLGVGAVVWMRSARARAAFLFALLCQAMFLFLVLSPSGRGGILDWAAYWGDLVARLLAPALVLHITLALGDEERGGRRWHRAIVYLPALILLAHSLYLIPLHGVYRFSDPEAAIRLRNRLVNFYTGVCLLAGIVAAVRSYLMAERLQTRWQLKWMSWGSLAGFLPFALLYQLPLALNIPVGSWSELAVLPMAVVPLAFAAAIVRYRLLDLDIFLKRGIMAIVLLLCAAATYAACYVVMDRAAGGITPAGLNLALILATFLMAIFYPRLHARLKAAIDQVFYRERYDYRRTLIEFGEALNRELSLPALRRKFMSRVERTFGLGSACVFVRERDGAPLLSDDPAVPGLGPDDALVRALARVDYLSLRDHPEVAESESGARLIDGLGLEYLLPLTVEGELVAALGVGRPRGGEPLTSEDLQLLVSSCRHAAVAFEGARLYSAVAEKVREVESLKEFNESILESSRVGILVADTSGRVVGVNRALERLYGAPREEILGRLLDQVVPAGDGVAGPAEAQALPEEGIRLDRTTLRTRDGRRLLVNLTQSALRGADGEPRGRVVTVDDVTEQVRREEELQRREHLASIGLLASGIAHEVNTPLTGIASYTQMLLDGRRSDDPAVPILRKIEQQAFRAASIAASLLNFSRQRDGDYQNLDVAEMVRETLDLFQAHLRGRRITIERQVGAPLPPVHGNRGRLQQVVMNLLLNAVDAMPEGGILTVRAGESSGRVRLEIADTGVGIAPEHLERIYDPFFTTKPRGKGTGLGLSVSYGIVKEHAGTLTAESAPGEGSRFIISLPAADEPPRRAFA